MIIVSWIAWLLNLGLSIFFYVLLVRLVLGYIPLFQRGWRPRGFWLVVAEIVYTITDPPIRFFRRFIKPMNVGGIGLDLSFTVVMLITLVLMSLTRAFI